ncbi:hypothetical protein [Pseudoxanthomonas sp. JBR18]|uniref:hypothetical protein n=1 Tax=Pseudoxanthomonas sp. JBR18 TaxID=2969308 RepID=UPI002306A38C|nr:hypothetical protein [Pseudoxanthomonas sp. JBR18]WCE05965.1 hypothetical protein PJ250_08460 [Pseudoxanthomonas sp. JBR18]
MQTFGGLVIGALFGASLSSAVAQQTLTFSAMQAAPAITPAAEPASSAAPASASAATAADARVPTLGQVQALAPEDTQEALNLHAFRNPVTVDPNTFSKSYDPGISPEEMALKYDGYVNYGLNMGLLQTWKGIKRVTGMRPYEHPASARPPPLTQAQMRRAVQALETEDE